MALERTVEIDAPTRQVIDLLSGGTHDFQIWIRMKDYVCPKRRQGESESRHDARVVHGMQKHAERECAEAFSYLSGFGVVLPKDAGPLGVNKVSLDYGQANAVLSRPDLFERIGFYFTPCLMPPIDISLP